jgi:hypothetical protein
MPPRLHRSLAGVGTRRTVPPTLGRFAASTRTRLVRHTSKEYAKDYVLNGDGETYTVEIVTAVRCRHLYADPDRQAQRCRSSGRAHRYPRTATGSFRQTGDELVPWNWKRERTQKAAA